MPYPLDRKSTRLNSSHTLISYAVFCLKKKKAAPNYHRHHTREPEAPTQPARHASAVPELSHLYLRLGPRSRGAHALTFACFFKEPVAGGIYPFSQHDPLPI